METLAFLQVAVDYEDPASPPALRAFENMNLETVKSIAMGCIVAGLVTGVADRASAIHTSLSYGDRGPSVAALQSALGDIAVDGIFGSETLTQLKKYQAAHGLAVDGIAGSATLNSLGLLDPAQASLQTEQYGRLMLINDMPYEAIILIYEPDSVQEEYSSYAYLPPCSKRELQATYSNRWQVSLNNQKPHPVENLNGEFFEIRTSGLKDANQKVSLCQEQATSTEESTPTINSVAIQGGGGKGKEVSLCQNQSQADGGKPTADLVSNSTVLARLQGVVKSSIDKLDELNDAAKLGKNIVSVNADKARIQMSLFTEVDDSLKLLAQSPEERTFLKQRFIAKDLDSIEKWLKKCGGLDPTALPSIIKSFKGVLKQANVQFNEVSGNPPAMPLVKFVWQWIPPCSNRGPRFGSTHSDTLDSMPQEI